MCGVVRARLLRKPHLLAPGATREVDAIDLSARSTCSTWRRSLPPAGETHATHIKKLTSRLEVADRTAYEWNETLLDGFLVWRLLNAHGGGVIEGDLLNREIRYAPLS